MEFPEFYLSTVVGIINRKPYAVYINLDIQCPLDQEAKFSYTAKWSSGYTDMQSSLDQEAKSSKTAKWSSGTL